jgi:predicted transposase/invertase (TIGR01784 family)
MVRYNCRREEKMELTNTMAQMLAQPDRKADYDKACKNLLSEKSILAWIMKECVDEYRDCSLEDIAEKYIEGESLKVATSAVHKDSVDADRSNPGRIKGGNTEDFSENEGTVYYDIRFNSLLPGTGKVSMILNVEAQKDSYPGYPLVKRGLYYCSRLISSQYETEFSESNYGDIKKVCSIFICTNPAKKKQNSITKYSIHENTLVGNATDSNYDLINLIMIYLGKDSENKIIKLLHLLLLDHVDAGEKLNVLSSEFGIKVSKPLEREVMIMCNVSEQIEERGIEKGIEKGRTEGLEKGRTESIENLMKSMGVSADEAMKILLIPEEEREKYKKLLNV